MKPPQRPVRMTTPYGTRWCTEVEAAAHLSHPSSAAVVELAYCPTWRARFVDFLRRALGVDQPAAQLDETPHPRHPRSIP